MNSFKPENKQITLGSSVFIIFLCIFFGANSVAIKVSLAGLGSFFMAGLRFGIASIVITLWMVFTKQSLRISRNQWWPVLIVSILFTIQIPLYYFGLSNTAASRGVLIMNIQPFFVLILAHFFIQGDQINLKKLLGILLGFTGIIFVFLEKKGTISNFRTGDTLILLSSVIWSVSAVYTKKIITNFNTVQLALFPMIFSFPLILMASYFWDDVSIGYLDTSIILSIGYQSLLTASIGFVVWMGLLNKYGAVELHSFIFIMPVSGVLLGRLILKELITYKITIAVILVTTGLIVTNYKDKAAAIKK